jgi:ketosteroid isomerase-like protein
MNRIPYLFIFLLFLTACTTSRPDPELLKQELMKTDQDFSQMSMDKGMREAFIFYCADDVIKLRDNAFPIFGKQQLVDDLKNLPDSTVRLRWAPVKAEADGTIGYTFGKWELRLAAPDTMLYGVYITVWRKMPDGKWKYVLDGGNSTPKP